MDKEQELLPLPCPFCGRSLVLLGKLIQKLEHPYETDADAACAGFRLWFNATPENIAAWNRRSSSDEQRAEVWPEHASPLPWKYVRVDHGLGQVYDRIEDASGGVVVEHVGHIDGPAICAAVNLPTPILKGEGE